MYLVATLYHLVPLPAPAAMQAPWKAELLKHAVTGTILLTPEGINGTIAGPEAGVRAALKFMLGHAEFAKLAWKESWSPQNPFPRTKVKLKRETIPLGHPVNPQHAGAYLKPADWNAFISQPNVITIDTRNDYEVQLGQFVGAQNPATRTFKELPAWLEKTLPTDKNVPIAMYCTGGIRCEKSTAYLKERGFENVYHLEGGILKYLEDVPAEQSLWQGACYVFDDRVAVDHSLAPVADLQICKHCNAPVNAADVRRGGCARCAGGVAAA
jgi:UPF0176 protein